MKTYKGANKYMICWGNSYSHQFEIGIEYEVSGEIIPCRNGFHSCEQLKDVFRFYPFNGKNRFFECKVSGEIVHGKNKLASRKIKLIRELDEGDVALAAVQQSGFALQFVKDQTPEICLAAVQQSGCALEFVKDPVLKKTLKKEIQK